MEHRRVAGFTTTDESARLSAYLDREEVRDVILRLAVCTDLRQPAELGELLADDVAMDVSMGGQASVTLQGRDNFLAALGGLKDAGVVATHHLYPNMRVSVSGNEANAYMSGTVTYVYDDGQVEVSGVIVLADFRRTQHDWQYTRFAARYIYGFERIKGMLDPI